MGSASEKPAARILLVDDNEAIQNFMTEVFTSWGPFENSPCAVTTAGSVVEADEKLGTGEFDLIILDMVLGDGNGLQVLETVRTLTSPPPPVVVVSADDPPDLQRRAMELGAHSFLRKGDGVESLVRTTLTVLDAAPSRAPEPETLDAEDRRTQESGPGRILIVDDDPLVSDALGSMINLLEDVEVRLALGGREGLATAGEWNPHVILLDIAMPDLDGRQTLQILTEQGIKARVIMVSAFRDSEIAQECIDLGAVDYIPKPVDFPFLKRAVAGHLALARREAVRRD